MSSNFIKVFVNPFEDNSDKKLFIIGLTAYLLSSLLVYFSGNHFQGIISVKSGIDSHWLWSFYNNGLAIVLLTALTYLFSLWKNRHIRFIDILNVVLISRIVIYGILILFVEPFVIKDTLMKVELAVLDDDFMLQSLTGFDKTILMAIGLFSVFLLIYFFYFFIKGVRFVMNSKSGIDVLWLLIIVFGLEIAFTLLNLNHH